MLDIDVKTAGKFSKIFRLLDSSSEGQREAALHQLHRLLSAHNATLGGVLDEFAAVESEAARLKREQANWQAANDALAAEVDELRHFILTMSREPSLLFALVKLGFRAITLKRVFVALAAFALVWSLTTDAVSEGVAWSREAYYSLRNITTAEDVMRQRLTTAVERTKWQPGDGEPFLDRFKDPITGDPVFYWYVLRGTVAEQGEIVNGNAAKLQKRCTYGYALRTRPRNEPNVLATPEYFDAPMFRGAFARIKFDQIVFRCAVIPADK